MDEADALADVNMKNAFTIAAKENISDIIELGVTSAKTIRPDEIN